MACASASRGQELTITEFMAVRSIDILDDDRDRNDFIEIYNNGPSDVPMGGYFLSDDCANPLKWSFPAGITLQSGNFFLVWASEKDRRDPGFPLHTNFRLNGDGECVVLSDPAGEQIHGYSNYPNQQLGYSYGLAMNGDQAVNLQPNVRHYFSVPTPGFANVIGLPGISEGPLYSEASGTYPPGLSITLQMEVPVAGTEIRYTLDETVPDENSTLYTEPIDIEEEVVIAARAFQPGLQPSKPIFRHYLILGPDLLNFSSPIPVIVCSTLDRRMRNSPGGCGQGPYTDGRFLMFTPGESGRAALTDGVNFEHFVGYRKRGNLGPRRPCGREKFFFNMEFRNRERQDDDELLFEGWANHSDYAVYGAYDVDRSFMRNPIAYWMSREIGHWSPRTQFVECFLRNPGVGELTMADYWGIYVIRERNERGVGRIDINRLDIKDNEEPDITGGYIIQRDRIKAGDVGTSAGEHSNLVIDYPKTPTTQQYNYIGDYLNDMVDSFHPDVGSQADLPLVDFQSLVDFHILNWYPKNADAFRLSAYLYKPRGGRLVFGPLWDYDRSMGCAVDPRPQSPVGYGNTDFPGDIWDAGTAYFEYPGGPAGGNGEDFGSWYGLLFDNEPPTGSSPWARAYRARWRELRQGPLSTENISNQIDEWAALLIEPAARNHTRWPEVASRFRDFLGEAEHLKNWLISRAEWIDGEFVEGPVFNPPGGEVEAGIQVQISSDEDGQIYYTLNGPDPRGSNGLPDPSATAYTGLITIEENTLIRARSWFGAGVWSTLVEESYLTDAVSLVVSEVMYNPRSLPGDSFAKSDYEFVEIYNPSASPSNLVGVVLGSPSFDFSTGAVTTLPGSGHVVVVKNQEAFVERHGSDGILIAGEWVSGVFTGSLSNSSQNILLKGPAGETLLDFDYQDSWVPSTDGQGRSLVIRSPTAPPKTWNDASSWRESFEDEGSPGREDLPPGILRVPSDLNSNGRLDLGDVLGLLFNLFDPIEFSLLPCETGASNRELQDADGDGVLTVNDALLLVRHLYLSGPPPEAGVGCVPIAGCPQACSI